MAKNSTFSSMDSVLEELRSRHEERERLEEAMVLELKTKKTSRREEIISDHRIKYFLDRFAKVTQELAVLYQGKDGHVKTEVDSLSKSSSDLIAFYSRLKEVKTFYSSNPDEVFIPMSSQLQDVSEVKVSFTDEELHGKLLDLNSVFNLFVNIKGIPKTDYVTFLFNLDKLDGFPKERKHRNKKNVLPRLPYFPSSYICLKSMPYLPYVMSALSWGDVSLI